MTLLEVRNLKVYYPVERGLLGGAKKFVRAVDDGSFSIAPRETVGLVGESGCGKTTLGRAVIRLQEPTGGKILFQGENITNLAGADLRILRRQFQMIFQDPYGSLDPRMQVEDVIGEALEIHNLAPTAELRKRRVNALLADVGLDSSHARRYPHQLSGGQRQRIGIARALAVEPRLIVCDEPVSALDVSVQAQIINLLQDLQHAHGIAYLFVAHDLAVVEHICQRILVMYLGRIVESGETGNICRHPKHPYTQALMSAVPTLDPDSRRRRIILSGEMPSPLNPPSGCPFHPRCPIAETRCSEEAPVLREIQPGRQVACHLACSDTQSAEGATPTTP